MLIFMLVVSVVVSFVYIFAFSYFQAWLNAAVSGFFVVSFSFALFMVRPKKVSYKDGWNLGRGLNIDNPEEEKYTDDIVIEPSILSLGVLGVGSPGSGKTWFNISLAQQQRSLFPESGGAIFEGKGDFDIYQGYMTAGCIPDFFFSSELPHSDSLNVMAAPTESVIDMLGRVLIDDDGNGYYTDAQETALRYVIPLLKCLGVPVNLQDLFTIYKVEEAAEYVLGLARDIADSKEGAERKEIADIVAFAEDYFSEDTEKRLNKIDGLLNKLSPFVNGVLKDRLNSYTPTLDIPAAVKNSNHLYFHLPYSGVAKKVAIMITETFGVVAKDRQLDANNERVLFPLDFDDWGAFFYSNYGPITSRCRSAKMPCSFFFQSKGQMDGVSTNFTTEILDNVAILVGLMVHGADTAKWLSSQYGEYTSTVSSQNMEQSNMMISTRDVPRVKYGEFKDLDIGECFLSTYRTDGKGISDRFMARVRIPAPVFTFEEPKDWPVIDSDFDHDAGLNLWGKFMNRENRRESQKKAVEEELALLNEEDDESFDSDSSDEWEGINFL